MMAVRLIDFLPAKMTCAYVALSQVKHFRDKEGVNRMSWMSASLVSCGDG